jgi:hypothetical protein
LPEQTCGKRVEALGTTITALRARKAKLREELDAISVEAPSRPELTDLNARVRDVLTNGEAGARKAVVHALPEEIRVYDRQCILPTFRTPGGANAQGTGVRPLYGSVHPTFHNPNTLLPATPLVSGPVIHLPGQHDRVRRDGYRTDRP